MARRAARGFAAGIHRRRIPGREAGDSGGDHACRDVLVVSSTQISPAILNVHRRVTEVRALTLIRRRRTRGTPRRQRLGPSSDTRRCAPYGTRQLHDSPQCVGGVPLVFHGTGQARPDVVGVHALPIYTVAYVQFKVAQDVVHSPSNIDGVAALTVAQIVHTFRRRDSGTRHRRRALRRPAPYRLRTVTWSRPVSIPPLCPVKHGKSSRTGDTTDRQVMLLRLLAFAARTDPEMIGRLSGMYSELFMLNSRGRPLKVIELTGLPHSSGRELGAFPALVKEWW